MVEGARLESVYTGNCIKGSNPLVSAKLSSLIQKFNKGLNLKLFIPAIYTKNGFQRGIDVVTY